MPIYTLENDGGVRVGGHSGALLWFYPGGYQLPFLAHYRRFLRAVYRKCKKRASRTQPAVWHGMAARTFGIALK